MLGVISALQKIGKSIIGSCILFQDLSPKRNYLLKELTMYVKEMKLLKDTVQNLLKIILLVLNTIAYLKLKKIMI